MVPWLKRHAFLLVWTCLLIAAGLILRGAPSREPPSARQTVPANVEALGVLPFRFERNLGQADPRAQFVSRGRGYTLFLSPGEAIFVVGGSLGQRVIRMKFAGADSSAVAEGESELPERSNYFVGGDPDKWRMQIPGFGRVRYKEVYPGIARDREGNQGVLPCVAQVGRARYKPRAGFDRSLKTE